MAPISKSTLLLSAAISSVLACSGAHAQQAERAQAPRSAADIGEIIVTANKRAERVQDVAMSVSAVSADELRSRQTQDLQDLVRHVPGLNIQQGGYGGVNNRIILRGLNTGNQGGATVASVVDDIPFSLSGSVGIGSDFATDLDVYDMERVEVLRGPQGTLYGAAAEGGLIKYVTRAPDPSAFSAGGEASGLDYAHGKTGGGAKAYVNIPLSDTVAMRASGYYDYVPGWVDNELVGRKDTNTVRRYGGRLGLLFRPSEALTLRATAMLQERKLSDLENVEVNGYKVPADPFARPKGINKDSFLLQPASNRARQYSVTASYDFGPVSLESLSSYGTLYYDFATDSSFYGYLNNAIGLFGRPNTTLTQVGEYGMKKYSQELRLASSGDGTQRFDWQAGAFFTRERVKGLNHYVTRDYPSGAEVNTAISPASSEVFFTNAPGTYREVALYADSTFHVTPALDFEIGARGFKNRQSYSQTLGGALFGFPITDTGTQRSSEDDWTWSTSARYRLTADQIVYARVASGYRPGGPQAIIIGGPPNLPSQFTSDSTINYEIGYKGTTANRALSFDVALFYIDWTDVQVTQRIIVQSGQVGGGAAYPLTLNVGAARSQGVEWNLVWTPVERLNLGASGAWTDAELTRDALDNGNARKGDELPYVAKTNLSFTADYEWPLTDVVTAYAGAGWNYIGKRKTDFNLNPTLSHLDVPAYRVYDARVGARFGRYSAELFGKNLGDERGITYYARGQLIFGVDNPGVVNLIRPRTIGVRFSADF